MTTLNEKLNQLNACYPEAVVRLMENIIHEMEKHLNQISNKVEPEDFERLMSNYEYLKAFFLYVYPLIEPIAYCHLDQTILLGEDGKDILFKLQSQVATIFQNGTALTNIAETLKDLDKNINESYR